MYFNRGQNSQTRAYSEIRSMRCEYEQTMKRLPISISLVMPSYNQSRYLEAAIRSVVNQDFKNLEYILMDGGSTDESLSIIKKYEGHFAYWQSKKDGGQADAINSGWRMAGGDLLCWLNSDDYLHKDALQTVAEKAVENPTALLFVGDCQVVDIEGNIKNVKRPKDFTKETLLEGRSLPQPSVFIRKEVLQMVGFLDHKLHYALDWAYFLKVLWSIKTPIVYIPQVLSTSREYEGTKTRTGQRAKGVERRQVLSAYFSEGVIPNSRRLRNIGISGTYWVQGTDQFLAGRYLLSFVSFFVATYYNPSEFINKIRNAKWILIERSNRRNENRSVY
jgi:glycosyltransferase involved in cell wall biosynthesis